MRIEIKIVMMWDHNHHIVFQENAVFTIYNGLCVGDIVRPLRGKHGESETSKRIFKRVYKK